MLLQLFSADDVDAIFGGADAMHALMRDPVFGHSASSWLGEEDAPSLSDEAKRGADPGDRRRRVACGPSFRASPPRRRRSTTLKQVPGLERPVRLEHVTIHI